MCDCRSSRSRPTPPAPSAPAPSPRRPSADEVVLRYVGKVSLLVKGRVSGRAYALRPGARINCDRRDVPAFLASPLFEGLDKHHSKSALSVAVGFERRPDHRDPQDVGPEQVRHLERQRRQHHEIQHAKADLGDDQCRDERRPEREHRQQRCRRRPESDARCAGRIRKCEVGSKSAAMPSASDACGNNVSPKRHNRAGRAHQNHERHGVRHEAAAGRPGTREPENLRTRTRAPEHPRT